MTENEIPSLAELLTSALEQCQERGMPLPYLLVMAGINGCILAARYVQSDDGLEAEVLIDDGGVMALPINIMIIDATGEAARVSITKDEGMKLH
jgi:hypothetical protein